MTHDIHGNIGQELSLAGEPNFSQLGKPIFFRNTYDGVKVVINLFEVRTAGWITFSLWNSDRIVPNDDNNLFKLSQPKLLLESSQFSLNSSDSDLVLPLPSGSLIKFGKYIALYRKKSDKDVTGKVTAHISIPSY